MGYRHTIMHWCSGYPQYIINWPKIHVKGLYLVQQLSSEIKLRIHTALGTTIYPTSPLHQTWSRIAKGTPILIIAPTGGRLVSGLDRLDMGISRSCDFGWEGLRHLGWSGDTTAEAEVDARDSVGQWWMVLHIHR